MTSPDAFDELARLLGGPDLLRAVAAGRRRGHALRWRRTELRPVDLSGERHLQVTRLDATQAFTENHPVAAVPGVVAELLAEPWANWHVWTSSATVHVQVSRKGVPLLRRGPVEDVPLAGTAHDRSKERLLAPTDPVLRALGLSDEQGRVKPSRQAKYRQVEELVRALDASLEAASVAGVLRRPTEDDPWRLVDLGCGNAALTFAAHRFLAGVRGLPVRLVGVDRKEQALRHNRSLAEELGCADEVRFVRGDIGSADLPPDHDPPDVVLALHACDTATDDALAQAVRWQAPLVLAAPCCHHDLAAQLRGADVPPGQASLLRDGILRERFADTLTDALRATLLRSRGYRVEVTEFVESRHTPRNTLLRAVRTGGGDTEAAAAEAARLVDAWQVRPRLAELLGGLAASPREQP